MRSMNTRIFVLAVLFIAFVASSNLSPSCAAASLNDISGHWAQTPIENLLEQGVVTGNQAGSFMPDAPITRAEFIVMINRAFGFTNMVTINFTDVSSQDWFRPEIARAAAAGYVVGSNGMVFPNKVITRAEAATMLVQAAKLSKLDSLSSINLLMAFSDNRSLPPWSLTYIATAVKAGYMSGESDGTFSAEEFTTKAMAAVMLNQALRDVKTIYSSPGTYGPASGTATIDGDVIISAPGVTLKNTIFTGNILVSRTVGEGAVTLNKVTVKGDTVINGGGADAIILDACYLTTVTVNKGDVNVACLKGTRIVILNLAYGSTIEVSSDSTVENINRMDRIR